MSTGEKTWIIKDLISTTAGFLKNKGIESARLDTELMLSKVTGLSRINLYTAFDRVLTKPELDSFRELVRQRAERKPVKYILGEAEFYSLKFRVSEDVLLPRPETEHLVDAALEFLGKKESSSLLLDVCTGSGCIAVAVAANNPGCEIWASDISGPALEIARCNAAANKVEDRIKFFAGDLFDAFGTELPGGSADFILSNPPYVAESEIATLAPEVRDYGPKIALDGGADGLDFYRRIVSGAASVLREGGCLMLEIDGSQAAPVSDMIIAAGMKTLETRKDYQGHARVLIAKKE